MASWAGMIGGLAVGLKDIEEEFQNSYLFKETTCIYAK